MGAARASVLLLIRDRGIMAGYYGGGRLYLVAAAPVLGRLAIGQLHKVVDRRMEVASAAVVAVDEGMAEPEPRTYAEK